MSRLEIEAIRIFASDLRYARKIKTSVIKLAKEEPKRVIEALKYLPENDQGHLRWLRTIAEGSTC